MTTRTALTWAAAIACIAGLWALAATHADLAVIDGLHEYGDIE